MLNYLFLELLKKFCIFIFCLHWIFIAAHRLSLVAESGDYSPVAVRGLLIVVTSCWGAWALGSAGFSSVDVLLGNMGSGSAGVSSVDVLLGSAGVSRVAHRLSSCSSPTPEHRLS